MTVRRFLRHVGVGVMLAGLALAIAVVALPPGWMQMRLVQPALIVYLQADRGALQVGEIDGPPPVDRLIAPEPRRAKGLGDFLSAQFATEGEALRIPTNMGNYVAWRRSVLGVSAEWLKLGNARLGSPPLWTRRELRLPAWLLALPGVIWLSIRLRRKLVNRSRPTGFDVLPAREGDG